MVQPRQHIIHEELGENKNHSKTNMHQKEESQSSQFQNENNMPSTDGIFHATKQLLKQKDTISNILPSLIIQNKAV